MSDVTEKKPKPRRRSHGPHFDGRRFRNPAGRAGNGFLHFLGWITTSRRARWPKRLDDRVPPQILTTHVPDQIAATFIGHSTFLLQFAGLKVLTDRSDAHLGVDRSHVLACSSCSSGKLTLDRVVDCGQHEKRSRRWWGQST